VADPVDLVPGGQRKYKLPINALKPGEFGYTLRFTNKKTHEYIFYKIVKFLFFNLTFLEFENIRS